MILSASNANVGDLVQSSPRADSYVFEQLLDNAVELVLFGSRAAGVHSAKSDWDLFVVVTEKPQTADRLDVVWRTLDEIDESKWLGSELASHIAKYGVSIRGRIDWATAVRLDEAAINKKHRRLSNRVEGLWNYWDRLHPEFRQKYMKTIRREIQRLQLLTEDIAIPPTPMLDRSWIEDSATVDKWSIFVKTLELGSTLTRERLLRVADLITAGSLAVDQTTAFGPLTQWHQTTPL